MKRSVVTPRPNWQQKAESLGFGFHTMYGAPYWDESRAWQFSLAEVEDQIEDPSAELHAMCLSAVDHILADPKLMRRLAIPEIFHEEIRSSWARRDPHFYGRFDLAYDGRGPAKMLEYNADTPTSLYEAGFFQWLWLEDMVESGQIPADADQFNSIQEQVIKRLGEVFPAGSNVHFSACAGNEEDRQTVRYIEDCATQAGLFPHYVDIEAIGIDEDGRLADANSNLIERLFKLYPLEHMFREDFGVHLIGGKTQMVEPIWKSLLSNKGILPVLWEMYPNHPNLLPSFFEDDPRRAALGKQYVRKPLFSREGANIQMFRDGRMPLVSKGEYGEEGYVLQGYAPLAECDGDHAVIGSWIVGDVACGMGIREDRSMITKDLSRFVPHYIV